MKHEVEAYAGSSRRVRVRLNRDVVLQPSRAGARHEPVKIAQGACPVVYAEDCRGAMTALYYFQGPSGIGLQVPPDAVGGVLPVEPP